MQFFITIFTRQNQVIAFLLGLFILGNLQVVKANNIDLQILRLPEGPKRTELLRPDLDTLHAKVILKFSVQDGSRTLKLVQPIMPLFCQVQAFIKANPENPETEAILNIFVTGPTCRNLINQVLYKGDLKLKLDSATTLKISEHFLNDCDNESEALNCSLLNRQFSWFVADQGRLRLHKLDQTHLQLYDSTTKILWLNQTNKKKYYEFKQAQKVCPKPTRLAKIDEVMPPDSHQILFSLNDMYDYFWTSTMDSPTQGGSSPTMAWAYSRNALGLIDQKAKAKVFCVKKIKNL